MSFETIRLDHVGPVAKIVLNRPERLNACPPTMAVEISDALAMLVRERLTGQAANAGELDAAVGQA